MNLLVALCLLSAAPLEEKVPPVIHDRQDWQSPANVHLSGWLGTRITASEANRLAKLDPARLLEGYRHRPGRQSWDGEHVGKWLHAATLAWLNTGDPALRAKLDYVAAELCKCQLADGYLGTYAPKDRWTQWDVWAHKYNLIGLITYVRYTGNDKPLETCRRMADLLCDTFGDAPGKRDIIVAGEHVGLAPTSVLEPMVLLYRMTGEKRYLDFCKYLMRAWEQPNGPHVISRLLTLKRVDKVGNGKAYEMLSCLNGLLEYYRTTGDDPKLLAACLNAWQDIVDKRLYPTGSAGLGEFFRDDFDLPSTGNLCETCVTVTWIQFNAQLLRLTGEARFAEQLEHTAYNQLLGSQQPDGTAWGYYVQMEGTKPYSSNLDGNCCLSSGPRGIALLPTFAMTTDEQGIVVNLYEAGRARLTLRDGTEVTAMISSHYPSDGKIDITFCAVRPAKKAKHFAVKFRVPAWCREWEVVGVAGDKIKTTEVRGYQMIERDWVNGDSIDLRFKLQPRVVAGDHLQAGKGYVAYGPLVLAADEALLKGQGIDLKNLAIAGKTPDALNVQPQPAPEKFKTWDDAQTYRVQAIDCRHPTASPVAVDLIPFADAGATGSRYQLWIPIAGANR